MKSHERLRAEGFVETYLMEVLYDEGHVGVGARFTGRDGDFRIEIKATYLGSRSKKRLKEPAEDVVD